MHLSLTLVVAAILLALLLLPSFTSRNPKKVAICNCIKIVAELKKDSDFKGVGSESALDEYRMFHELIMEFKLTPEEVGVQNFKVVARQALDAFIKYTLRCSMNNSPLHKQLIEEFNAEFIEPIPQLVRHNSYETNSL